MKSRFSCTPRLSHLTAVIDVYRFFSVKDKSSLLHEKSSNALMFIHWISISFTLEVIFSFPQCMWKPWHFLSSTQVPHTILHHLHVIIYIAVMPFPIHYKTVSCTRCPSFGRTELFSAQQVPKAKIVVPVSLYTARPFHLLVSNFHPIGALSYPIFRQIATDDNCGSLCYLHGHTTGYWILV